MSGVALARLCDVPEAGALVVTLEREGAPHAIILTRRGAAVSAFRNRCAHAEYALERLDGRLIVQEGRYLVCAAHGASYEMDTGACAGGPCNGKGLERVAIIVRDGLVFAAEG